MIGQQGLIDLFTELGDDIPQFIIITGAKGSGKKTLVKEVLVKDSLTIYAKDNSASSMREIVNLANNLYCINFVIPDADTMSLSAQNVLLKVVEECPNKNYFIMTLTDENNILETIRSRAVIYRMGRYTVEDIEEYTREYAEVSDKHTMAIYTELCDTPYDVQLLTSYGAEDFYSYVYKVVDNIATVSGSNSFKIAEKISFKDETDKYDLKLFWKAFIICCLKHCCDCSSADVIKYAHGSQITSRALRDLYIKGINKQALFDRWILDIRQEWM